MCEAFNGTICRARTKPLIHMLEDIRNYVMERIYSKQNLMSHDLVDDTLCSRIKKKLEKLVGFSARSVARPSVGGLFQVHEGVDAYSVCLNERTCTCKAWQLTGLPCRHAIASISFMRVDPCTYVDDVYRKFTHKKYYRLGLPPMNGERMWPKVPGEPIKPPPYRVMPGRPKKN
ncbi:unnamed protein product [Cuscuta europaea]|nr:unnamed protein product [Cuscuta europaea]